MSRNFVCVKKKMYRRFLQPNVHQSIGDNPSFFSSRQPRVHPG